VREIGQRYPHAGYGGTFIQWLYSRDPRPYNSWGNGSAMRVSPVGFAFSSEDEVLEHAKMTAEISHNHPEGIKGAQAAALAVFLARTGAGKEEIRTRITDLFAYDLNRTVDDIRPGYFFDVSCRGTVPEAIISFLDSAPTRMRFETPFHWAGTATPWPASREGLQRRFTVPSLKKFTSC
jgi:ADP-ribosylglycohydrolase